MFEEQRPLLRGSREAGVAVVSAEKLARTPEELEAAEALEGSLGAA